MAEPLRNPERDWAPDEALASVTREEIEQRIGPITEPWRVLPGGLANTNVHLPASGRLLRIYRRDVETLAKEVTLLSRPYRHLRVPRLLGRGGDFLVLEYVPHGPLLDDAASGADAGRALAEIHGQRFIHAGELDGDLHVVDPWPDLVDAFVGFLDSLDLHGEAADLRGRVAERLRRDHDELSAIPGIPVLLHADYKVSNLHRAEGGALLVLDWEFAYAGPALLDIGQLLRWEPPEAFCRAFADAYLAGGGSLPRDWRRLAALFDLVGLASLLRGDGQRGGRLATLRERIETILAD